MAKQGITEEKAQEIRSGEEKQMLQDAELLLKNGTIDEQNEDGVTLLHIAASKGFYYFYFSLFFFSLYYFFFFIFS